MQLDQYMFTGKEKFDIEQFDTSETDGFHSKGEMKESIRDNLKEMRALQDKLYAEGRSAVLIIFQAMDAAGKDSAIKHVFSGLNPQGVNVWNFREPSEEELRHDYLWRATRRLPSRGKIAIFNRSYYEEVLVAKVHQLYKNQRLPDRCADDDVIHERYGQIRNYEDYLWENGVTVLKFFLHVSKDEQRERLLDRIDDTSKNWKFSENDLHERQFWDAYQKAYEKAINETATERNPWFVLPADKKWYARAILSEVILTALREIDPQYPELDPAVKEDLDVYRKSLEK